jgi:hypothetical protein
MKIRAFWDTVPCSARVYWCFRGMYCLHHHPDDGGSMNLWNVRLLKWDYMALYSRKLNLQTRHENLNLSSCNLQTVIANYCNCCVPTTEIISWHGKISETWLTQNLSDQKKVFCFMNNLYNSKFKKR